jgi:hypothetical protein
MASVLPGQHLLIGETEYEPRIIQVVDVPLMLGNNNAAIGSVPPHDHGPTSSNPVFIDEWQVIPLRVVPIGDMEVRVNGGYITYKGNVIKIETTTIDLATSIPESGARYSLIRVDTEGVLDVQDGEVVDSFVDLSVEAIPMCSDYYLPLAFVKLYYGQTVLSGVVTAPDVQMLVWGGGLFDSRIHWDDIVDRPSIAQAWYLHEETDPDIVGYEVLRRTPGDDPENIENTVLDPHDTEILVEPYITENAGGMGVEIIEAGKWEFHTYARVDNTAGVTTIVIRVYKRDQSGTETELFNVETAELDNTSVEEVTVESIQSAFLLDATDRLVVKYYGKTTSVADVTLYFYYEGTENYTHFHIPGVDVSNPEAILFNDAEGDPTDVDATAAADGTSAYTARRDHRHLLGSHSHSESDITDLTHDAVAIQGADVPVPAVGDDGKALVYDHASGDFIYGEAGGATALDDLTDVNAAAPTEGQVLTWDDDPGEWIAADPTGGGGSGANFTWHIDGVLVVVDDVGPAFVAGMDMTLTKVTAYVKTPGTANTTTFDIELNGVSIFVTPPTIAYDDADQLVSATPDTIDVTAGDILTLNIDAIATGASSLTVCLYAQATPADLNQKQQVIFTVDGELEVVAGVLKIPNVTGRTLTLSKVYLIVGAAPVDASLIVDVNIDGTTIFTNQAHRPVILTTATTGSSTDLDVTSWADGSYLTMDVDQIGSTTAGSDLTVVIVYQ